MCDAEKAAVITAAMRIAATVALRHAGELTENERDAVLAGLVHTLPARESELAQDTLYHLREQRAAQMKLAGILEAQRAPLAKAS